MSWLQKALLFLTFGSLVLMAYRTFSQGAAAQGHRAQQFDGILAGRYAFMAFAFVCAALSGLTWMILSMLAALAAVAFWDAYVYAQATEETDVHVFAGALASGAFVLYGLTAVFWKG